MLSADTIILGQHIFTGNSEQPEILAVAISGDRIVIPYG